MTAAARWTRPADVHARVQRLWDRGRILAASFGGREALFPLGVPLRGPTAAELAGRFDEARRWIRELVEGSRETRGSGYELGWRDVDHRLLGANRVPASIVVPSEKDALALIGKERQAARFRALAERTVAAFPLLRPWLEARPLRLLEHADDWPRILAVLAWMNEHPRSGLYVRQLEIPDVDSKFIEERRGLLGELLDLVLPADAIDARSTGAAGFEQRYHLRSKPLLIRFRLLDERLRLSGLADLTVPAEDFARLDLPARRVFITENEINGLSFPPTAEAMVLFGLGYGLDRLGVASWLTTRDLHYWGDIDTHGFAILDRLRAAFPSARSFLMDRETLLAHRPVWGQERDSARHLARLSRLTASEALLYDDLRHDRLGPRLRLEQERISFSCLKAALARTVP